MVTEVAPKVLSWASDIDEGTVRQARGVRPDAVRRRACRAHARRARRHRRDGRLGHPDRRRDHARRPSGVDIGCGMIATETDLTAADLPDDLAPLHAARREADPGRRRQGPRRPARCPDRRGARRPRPAARGADSASRRRPCRCSSARSGRGNHFVEVCLDERDRVWTVLHSGSRGIGNQLAQHHIESQGPDEEACSSGLEDPDLAYLVEGTPEFDAYIDDMLWAQRYAMASRAGDERAR